MSTAASSNGLPNLIGRTIDNGRLQILDILGRGGFGVVYLAATTVGSQHLYYAVKCIRWNFSEQRDLPDEISLHKVCSNASPAVLKIHDVIEDEARNLLYIVMDYCPHGDLLDMIVSGRYAGNDELIRTVFIQILDAVEACHQSNIIHRDLKPENILCKDGGKQIVLADFGFASKLRFSKRFRMGSEPFMSPEVLGGLNRQITHYSTRQADIWALGVILMNLTCACLPWAKASLRDPSFLKYITRDPDYLLHSHPISRELNAILKTIFTADPRQRTSIPELRERIRSARRFGVAGVTGARDIFTAYADGILSDHSDDSGEGGSEEGEESDLEVVSLVSVHVAPLTVRNGYASDAGEDEAAAARATAPLNASASSTPTAVEPPADTMPQAITSGVRSTFVNSGTDADDEDSDDESDGPITPEQHAVDVGRAAVHLEDVPDFPGACGLGAATGVPVLSHGPTPVHTFTRKTLLAGDAPMPIGATLTDALAEAAGGRHGGKSARKMLRNAARRMGIVLRNRK